MNLSMRNVLRQLHMFSALDPKMQVSTILTLIEIAKADDAKTELSVGDISRTIGLTDGTASRNVNYWAKGARGMTGAHDMVLVDFHPVDRRLRSLRLTNKGRAFINQIFGD